MLLQASLHHELVCYHAFFLLVLLPIVLSPLFTIFFIASFTFTTVIEIVTTNTFPALAGKERPVLRIQHVVDQAVLLHCVAQFWMWTWRS